MSSTRRHKRNRTCQHCALLRPPRAHCPHGKPVYDDGKFNCVPCLQWQLSRAKIEINRLRSVITTIGDDYPGSSLQQWCRNELQESK